MNFTGQKVKERTRATQSVWFSDEWWWWWGSESESCLLAKYVDTYTRNLFLAIGVSLAVQKREKKVYAMYVYDDDDDWWWCPGCDSSLNVSVVKGRAHTVLQKKKKNLEMISHWLRVDNKRLLYQRVHCVCNLKSYKYFADIFRCILNIPEGWTRYHSIGNHLRGVNWGRHTLRINQGSLVCWRFAWS